MTTRNSVTLGNSRTSVATSALPIPAASVIVLPETISGQTDDTFQLTATVYDAEGAILTGRVVSWNSDDTDVATVDINGVVTLHNGGTATITANVEGKTDTVAASSVIPLVLTLDWAPVANPDERAMPLIFPVYASIGGGNGTHGYVPIQTGCQLWTQNRHFYARSADEWAACGNRSSPVMADDATPQWKNTTVVLLDNLGPYDNTSAFLATWPGAGWEDFAFVASRAGVFDPQAGIDDRDVTTWKRGQAVMVRAPNAGEVGKDVVVQLVANIDAVQLKTVFKSQTVTLTADWQSVGLNYDSRAQYTDVNTSWITVGARNTNGALSVQVAFYSSDQWQVLGDSPEWLHPMPWHDELGFKCAMEAKNIWGANNNDPTLYGGATKVGASATDSPLANRYWGGQKINRYTTPTNGGFTTDAYYQLEEMTDSFPSNTPSAFGYVGVRFTAAPSGSLPADGRFKAYLRASGGPRYGPVDLVADSARVQIATDGSRYYRARIPVNLSAEGYLLFKPEIENSGASMDVLAFGFYCTPEHPRQAGMGPHMDVGKPTVTAPVYNEAACVQIADIRPLLSTTQGFLGIRTVKQYTVGELLDGYASPDEYQSGPFGDVDYTIEGGDSAPNVGHVGPWIGFRMQRAKSDLTVLPQDYIGFDILVQFPAGVNSTLFPRFVAADKWLVWWHDGGGVMHVRLGIGHGTGTGITWLDGTQQFMGANVTISTRDTTMGKLTWDFSTATGPSPFHMVIGGDRDKVRFIDGWVQALAMGNTVSAATILGSIDHHVATRWGARADYR